MSPIREKLNSSLHKLGDKLKRVRSSEVIDGNTDIKKPRPHPSPASGSLALPLSDPPSTNSSLELIGPVPRSAGSASNPIDLTRSPAVSSPIDLAFTSSASMSTTPATTVTDRPDEDFLDQIAEDSKLARALQCELDQEHEHASPRLSEETAELDAELRKYLVSIDQQKCPKCRGRLQLSSEQVVARTKTMLGDEGVLHPYVLCKKCKVWVCTGCSSCNDRSSPPFADFRSGNGFKVTWCCDKSRLFLVWSVACGPEFHKLPPKQKDSSSAPAASSLKYRLRNRTKSIKLNSQAGQAQEASTVPEQPTSAAPANTKVPKIPTSKLPKGTGYGGSEGDPMGWSKKRTAPESKTLSLNRKKEQDRHLQSCWALYFRAMKLLLPSLTGSQSQLFDLSPEISSIISAMLSRSPLWPKASEVLRNDSVDDIAEQESLYNGLLDFVEAMGNHYSTFPLLVRELVLYPREDQLVNVSLDHDRLVAGVAADVEKSQSLLSVLQNLATQCRHLASASSAHLQAFGDEQEKAVLVLLHRIIQTYETLESNLHRMDIKWPPERKKPGGQDPEPGKNPGLASNALSQDVAEEALESLAQWHREHSVDEIPDEKMLETHTYAKSAKQMRSNGVIGRMRKLVTQVASLRTSLPEGIYVRHCSSRLDVMKVLITGPEGTPYENGLFEFDLFCPTNFPSSPPLMQFRTTGGGSVRFNPNLYECGKVCLSLLGTWSGQKWTEQSTILQILVSIQAMIFTDQPWYNEPGRERVPDQAASDRYNSQVQGWTLQHAILYWLNDRLSQPLGSDRCSAARFQSLHAKLGTGNYPVLKAAKGAPGGLPVPKMNPLSPFFDLMDDKPTKVQPKQPAASLQSQPNGAKWWQLGKPTPNPSSLPVPSNQVGGVLGPSSTGQGPPSGGVITSGQESKLPKQPSANQWPLVPESNSLAKTPSDGMPKLLTPADNSMWPKPNGNLDAFDQYADEFADAGLDEMLLMPDLEDAAWQGYDLQQQLLDQPDRAAADTNTRIDSNDDYVWGDVIRKHFAAKAAKMLKTAAEWRTTGKGKLPEDPILQELEDAMVRHGFVPDRKRKAKRGTSL